MSFLIFFILCPGTGFNSCPGGMGILIICICRLLLEEQGIISLWHHNLPSLEEAVLGLLESVLTNKESSPQKLEQLLEQALLVGPFILQYDLKCPEPVLCSLFERFFIYSVMGCHIRNGSTLRACCSMFTFFLNCETWHVERKSCSFRWGNVFRYTVLTCVSEFFRWAFIYSWLFHTIWLCSSCISHHLAHPALHRTSFGLQGTWSFCNRVTI